MKSEIITGKTKVMEINKAIKIDKLLLYSGASGVTGEVLFFLFSFFFLVLDDDYKGVFLIIISLAIKRNKKLLKEST